MFSLGRAVLALLLTVAALPANSEEMRIAAFNAELTRRNPGLLIGDLMAGDDPQIAEVVQIIQSVRPDVLLLTGVDFDVQSLAVTLLAEVLRSGPEGIDFPFHFIAPVNAGVPSGDDLDGDGRLATADDAWGFGYFSGQGGMVVLSRFPIDQNASRTFNDFRWVELPSALVPVWYDGSPFPSVAVQAKLRLSSVSHWDVVVQAPQGDIHLLAAHPTPPVFDGPEDANGRRNHDEIAFLLRYVEGASFRDDQGRVAALGGGPFVVLGDFNADPVDGDGIHDAIVALLGFEGLVDPLPASAGGGAATKMQAGASAAHLGDAALDTADWPDEDGQPGNMRVDFVLPSVNFLVRGSGVFWPPPEETNDRSSQTGAEDDLRHRLVWVDIGR